MYQVQVSMLTDGVPEWHDFEKPHDHPTDVLDAVQVAIGGGLHRDEYSRIWWTLDAGDKFGGLIRGDDVTVARIVKVD